MSEPNRNDEPVTYAAVLPPGITIGSTAGVCLGGPGPYSAVLPPDVRLNPDSLVASGTATFRADPSSADVRPSAADDDVKPDLLLEPPDQNPDDPPGPPPGTDP